MPGESSISKATRSRVASLGGFLWRNNLGAFKDKAGRMTRFGLANESKQMNNSIKSSDLIGILPVTITPEMVGRKVGIFMAIETKKSGWRFTSTDRELAQRRYIKLVQDAGGIAMFLNDPEQFDECVSLLYPSAINNKNT